MKSINVSTLDKWFQTCGTTTISGLWHVVMMVSGCAICLVLISIYCIKTIKDFWHHYTTYKMVVHNLYVAGEVVPWCKNVENHYFWTEYFMERGSQKNKKKNSKKSSYIILDKIAAMFIIRIS